MAQQKRVVAKDGRQWAGQVVLESDFSVDLVWVDQGVNIQVSIPRNLIAWEAWEEAV